jgi:hypothetical protein
MSSHPFFAAPANTLAPAAFWTANSISLISNPDDISNNRYRHRPTLPSSTVTSDQISPSFFFTLPPPNATTRTQPFRRLEDYRGTATHIERALESANTALNDAQEALETRNTRSHYDTAMPPMPPVVDLTDASPSRSPELHRHNGGRSGYPRPRNTNFMMTEEVQDRIMRNLRSEAAVFGHEPPLDLREHGRHAFEHLERQFAQPDPRERERQAIERQREARALWESNQPRRQALLPQRSRSRSPRHSSPPIRQRSPNDMRPGSSSSRPKSESPVESIDLTAVDEKISAADVLAKHGADLTASQKLSSDTGRTPLTSYKCPICMEIPTDLTATVCGHLFCHRCILETLKWSQNLRRQQILPGRRPNAIRGVCPVCRKELKQLDPEHKSRELVPVSIMRAQQMRQQKKTDVKGKGKGKARDEIRVKNGNRESSSDWMDRLVNLDDN